MKKVFLASLLLALAALSGCNKACKDLEAVCGRCADANVAAACLSVVDESDEDACVESIDAFELTCP